MDDPKGAWRALIVMVLSTLTTFVFISGVVGIELYIRPLFENQTFPLDTEIVLLLWSVAFILPLIVLCLKAFGQFWDAGKELSMSIGRDIGLIRPNREQNRPSKTQAEQQPHQDNSRKARLESQDDPASPSESDDQNKSSVRKEDHLHGR